ncbi:MAG: PaaI family thioesterase [Acidimicrobiales bacterium]
MSLQVPPNCDLTLGLRCVDKSVAGVTVWSMRADERMTNPAGLVQGGFLAAMADSAMGASAVTALDGRRASVVNTDLNVSLLRAVRAGTELTCTATVVRAGRRVTAVEARIVDDAGHVVATARSSFVVRDRPE